MASPQELISNIQVSVEKIAAGLASLTERMTKLEAEVAAMSAPLAEIDTKLQVIAGQLTPES